MAKEIDRVRAQSALAVIKQHPGMVLFAVSPVIIALGLVWWLVSPALAVLLLIGAVVGGGAVLLMKRQLTVPPYHPNRFAWGESRSTRSVTV